MSDDDEEGIFSREVVVDRVRESVISLGSSFVLDGVARLGPLKVECDGAIAGQIWGAGATMSSYLLSENGRDLIGCSS
jgi:hypothetical protein